MILFIPTFPTLVPVAVGYLGPDSLMPLGSALAAIVGVILLFGGRLLGIARAGLRKIGGQRSDAGPAEERSTAGETGSEAQE